MSFIKKLLRDSTVEKKYVKSGAIFGDVVSYLPMGECIGFEKFLGKWESWEKEYVRRGYRTISLDRFIEFGGHGKPIDDIIGQKREQEEEPIFHAQIYREKFLGKINPIINLEEIAQNDQPQFEYYTLPSTEDNNQDH